jgi:hypothetical protein
VDLRSETRTKPENVFITPREDALDLLTRVRDSHDDQRMPALNILTEHRATF